MPFQQCVARPDAEGRTNRLVDHLVAVARGAGDPQGSVGQRLGFLAGLLHDAGKCHVAWQQYVRTDGPQKKGPPHAPLGAALFCYVADSLVPRWCKSREQKSTVRSEILNWTLAVQGHHGQLGDFSAASLPWLAIGSKYSVTELVRGCDLAGIFDLVRQYYPAFDGSADDFSNWLGDGDRVWLYLVEDDRKSIVEKGEHHEIAMAFPRDFARLIVADRRDAGQLGSDELDPPAARRALSALEDHCRRQADRAREAGAAEELVQLRGSIQDRAAANDRASGAHPFTTLLLPTGYGKTLTALRVALEACAAGSCRRILYVAPYISILSQAARAIAEASGQRVFEHHHLSLAKIASRQGAAAGGDPLSSEHLRDSDRDFEILDTWQAPILATTFNQFFRALFPARAQHALRIGAAERAFIIVDEPQIIDIAVWNVFLRALEVFADQHGCRVLLATATLPPLEIGLQRGAVALAPDVPSLHRYDVEYQPEDWSLAEVTDRTGRSLARSPNVAVVLNTVRDAYLVFKSLRQHLGRQVRVYCLTAMMLSGHKHRTIEAIRRHLRRQRDGETDRKLVVVCTQILEAGVDLSFRAILRARSILPSIAQVAGRANRHSEGDPAEVRVFPFKSDGETELRNYVYRDATARRMTDRVFEQHPRIRETEMAGRLEAYFAACWQENSQSALLQSFERAALGAWSCLAGLEPFGFSGPQEDVFVPAGPEWIDPGSRVLLGRFAPEGPEQLLQRYLDGEFLHDLEFRERQLFHSTLRQFLVPTRRLIAERVAQPRNDWLWEIQDTESYSPETGLAHWLDQQEPAPERTTFVI
jgi:CRISPR-associated helicase Cas3/CRISPR-associated endonuclease Cas3-HD